MMIIAVWQLFLNYRTNGVEKEAAQYGQSAVKSKENGAVKDFTAKKLEQEYLDSISDEKVLNLGLISYSYNDLKKQQLQLGLDLKGGMSLVLQVDLRDLIILLADGNDQDEDFQAALKNATLAQQNSAVDYVTLFKNAFEEQAPDRMKHKDKKHTQEWQ